MDKPKKLKTTAAANLAAGYIIAITFIMLIVFKLPQDRSEVMTQQPVEVFVERNNTTVETVYVDRHTPRYVDHLNGIVIDDTGEVITSVVTGGRDIMHDNITNIDEIFKHDGDFDRHADRHWVDRGDVRLSHVDRDRDHVDRGRGGDHVDVVDDTVVDLQRRDPDDNIDLGLLDRRIREIDDIDNIGLNTRNEIALDRLTPVSNSDDEELGDIKNFDKMRAVADGGYGVGRGGQLYAYNFPSRGVGAGVGSAALGAGGGAGAGLGAGIGEGVLNGESVPTLGGVGTYTTPGAGANPGTGQGSGVGGLVGGAGAGGAAGLYTGKVTDMLGVGPGVRPGGGAGGYNYEHLPKDGALHIMMHVDGSGSILNTRKQLDIMRDTVLKTALLPYYNNDENLYNRRVTIVDGSGERTLNFFTQAADKENVLAIVFQDEAQPAYHLPNFNKNPEDHYLDDLRKLKTSLNSYGGVYRGVMFQVDRGKTFAKSFKEFVGNAFNGEGYLENDNLKKYHRDNNVNHVKNKNGIIFSDEYHAKDSGDPQYYLDLIFKASKRIGLDLDIHGAGLTDGKYNSRK